ncbi:MAG: PAS domain S-box protein [Planctomycetales bacterium]|nr:PAS domain S-box protein [Planctomycetales bacterium]
MSPTVTDTTLDLLVIEDDPDTQANLRDILELDDHRVECASTLAQAASRGNWDDISVVLLDRQLPDGMAEDFLPRLKRLAPEADVIVITGFSDVEGAITALRRGAADYILKPINPDVLRASLARSAERRHLRLAKEQSEEAFRTLVETADCLIAILRPDHTIVYLNPYTTELTGYRLDEVRGQDWLDVFVPPGQRPAATALLDGRSDRGREYPVNCRDGSRRWLLCNSGDLSDFDGGEAVLVVGQDITERKRAEERMLQSERLAAIGQMVTGLAHESRNALQRSKACLDLLTVELEGNVDALELVSRIHRAQDHLHRLYEEVRGYAVPIALRRATLDLRKLWRDTWADLAVARQDKFVRLVEGENQPDLDCSVDRHALEQVFRNILENAIHACPEPGEITVNCAAVTLDHRPAWQLAFRDNGPGLTAEQQTRIFEPFFTTKTQGTGLGMAITRRIVEAHGGQISAASGPVGGAEIVVTLPREP